MVFLQKKCEIIFILFFIFRIVISFPSRLAILGSYAVACSMADIPGPPCPIASASRLPAMTGPFWIVIVLSSLLGRLWVWQSRR